MGPRRRKDTVSLNDEIDVLDKNTVEDSPANRIFKTASAILALVQVSAVAPLCSLWTLTPTVTQQDKMIDSKDFVQLSESCFNVCEALDAQVRGKAAEDLDECVTTALEDLERYFN